MTNRFFLIEDSSRGMSLIEIMIGVIILSLVLVPSLNVIISETKTVNATRDHTQASFFAQQILEAARACSFELLDAEFYPGNKPKDENAKKKSFEYALLNNDDVKSMTINDIKYEVVDPKIEYAHSTNDPNVNLKMVYFSFKVKYTGQDSKTHFLDIFTAINERQ